MVNTNINTELLKKHFGEKNVTCSVDHESKKIDLVLDLNVFRYRLIAVKDDFKIIHESLGELVNNKFSLKKEYNVRTAKYAYKIAINL